MALSPDGKWMWTGSEWIPAPPGATKPPAPSNSLWDSEKVSTPIHDSESCGKCKASNVKIMTCSSDNCNERFCEICHSLCKIMKSDYFSLDKSKLSKLQLTDLVHTFQEYDGMIRDYDHDSITYMISEKINDYELVRERSEFIMTDLDEHSGLTLRKFDSHGGDGPYCESCLEIKHKDEKEEKIQHMNNRLVDLYREYDIKIKIKEEAESEIEKTVVSEKIIMLKEEQIHFKRFWYSVLIGVIVISLLPLISPGMWDSMADDDSDSLNLDDEPWFLFVAIIVDTACCFYPGFLIFAKGLNPFENPKNTLKELEGEN
jgi:hypothetical protein